MKKYRPYISAVLIIGLLLNFWFIDPVIPKLLASAGIGVNPDRELKKAFRCVVAGDQLPSGGDIPDSPKLRDAGYARVDFLTADQRQGIRDPRSDKQFKDHLDSLRLEVESEARRGGSNLDTDLLHEWAISSTCKDAVTANHLRDLMGLGSSGAGSSSGDQGSSSTSAPAQTEQPAGPTADAGAAPSSAAAQGSAPNNTNQSLPPSASAAGTYPFVGKRYFNFAGGSATGENITIAADGKTKIQMCGDEAMGGTCVVEYSGPFQSPMTAADGSGWLVQGDTVVQMMKGQAVVTCGDDEHQPCTSALDGP